jgi:hypothetical protein
MASMGRPPINGTQAMTATERQQRWRRRCREHEQTRATRPKPEPPRIIKPEAAPAGAHDEYALVIEQVLEFVDARPQSQLHLFRLIMRLQSAYQRRQQAAVETDAHSIPHHAGASRKPEVPTLHRSGDTIDQADVDLRMTVELSDHILDEQPAIARVERFSKTE